METEKLYYADAYLRRFTAHVVDCQAAKDGWRVVLDRTAFYPEGGGQPADHGEMNGIPVTDVHEKNGVIFHTCSEEIAVGTSVTCTLDWARRFDHMQQHSGEHIISGILCADYHCDNVGFHLGADTVTIDYNTDITYEQALAAEAKANAILWANEAVDIAYPSAEELTELDYRSKKELSGQVRIVTFPAADCCACCGTHVDRAGEVGLIKVLSCQKFREGVRMEIVCGQRALTYLSAVYEQAKAVGQRLSVKPVDICAASERQEAELTALKARMAEVEGELFTHIADSCAGGEDLLLFRGEMRPDAVRRLADAVAQKAGGLTAVFAGNGEQYAYALIRGDGADINPFVKAMNAALKGRGGGRSGFAQGSVQADRAAIEAFFANK